MVFESPNLSCLSVVKIHNVFTLPKMTLILVSHLSRRKEDLRHSLFGKGTEKSEDFRRI